NRWYELGIETAAEHRLPSGRTIRAVIPPVLTATKLAAWRGRGQGDVVRSLDVHDVGVLTNGRPELIDELSQQDFDLRKYVVSELTAITADTYFDYVVQDVVDSYGDTAAARAQIVRGRIAAIIGRLGAG